MAVERFRKMPEEHVAGTTDVRWKKADGSGSVQIESSYQRKIQVFLDNRNLFLNFASIKLI